MANRRFLSWESLMSARHFLRVSLLALTAGVAARPAVGGEPMAPIPQPAKDRYAEGQDLEKQGKFQEAVAAYQEAIRLGMQLFPRAHLKEAGAYLELREYDVAIARYTKFIRTFGLEDSCRY
jgi:tetratricopeptide (TPR) repeat protein